MKQIIQNYRTGKIKLEAIAMPSCRDSCVIVMNVCSAVSVGTEKLMIDTAKKSLVGKAMARPDLVRLAYEKAKREGFTGVFKQSMNRLDEPVPLGYSSSGVITEAGKGINRFKVGDRVACAGAGFASHAEYICIPEEFCARLPENIGFEPASFNMIGGIAVNGIRQVKMENRDSPCKEGTVPIFHSADKDSVAVIGLGLIGLITVQILKAEGYKVIGIDLNRERVKLAKESGADLALTVEDDVLTGVENLTTGNGVDAVIITAASRDDKPIRLAESICGQRGRIVLVGMADLKLTRKIFWEKELEFVVSKSAGPESGEGFTQNKNIKYFLELLSSGKVKLDGLITHRFNIEDAIKCYDMILRNKEPYIGVVFEYDKGRQETIDDRLKAGVGSFTGVQDDERKEIAFLLRSSSYEGHVRARNDNFIGVIGGGLFTRNVFMPVLKNVKNISFKGVATTKGVTSNHLAKKYGFDYATSDYREILNDKNIDSVIITTPHNLHAGMAIEALKAGKNVFVEKPLCIKEEELGNIVNAYRSSGKKLMVGFNRRFSPLANKMKLFLRDRTTPLVMNYRVNAGYIPKEHWTQDKEIGGGRIIGEICHFIDFFQFLTDSYPETVFASSIGGSIGKYVEDDNVCITVGFKDGSVGSIIYTAKGSKAFSRERVEVFCEYSVAVLEDFKKLQLTRGAKKKIIRKFSQDMGYKGELDRFFDLKGKDDKLFEGYLYTTIATFKVVESLETGEKKIIGCPLTQPSP